MSEIMNYEKEVLRVYRKWYADMYEINVTENEDIHFLISLLGSKTQKILEVACGGGRILIPLAQAGYHVKGFDKDELRLAYISKKAQGLKNIEYGLMDAISDEWGIDYDVVVLAGNLLHNIEADMPYNRAQQLFIKKAASCLKTHGQIYLEFGMFAHPEIIFSKDDGRIIFVGTDRSGVYGKQVLIGDGYDVASQIASGSRMTEIIMPDGKLEVIHEKFAKHIPTLDQVHHWLTEAGFKVIDEFGDYNKNLISENTYKAIILAEKLN